MEGNTIQGENMTGGPGKLFFNQCEILEGTYIQKMHGLNLGSFSCSVRIFLAVLGWFARAHMFKSAPGLSEHSCSKITRAHTGRYIHLSLTGASSWSDNPMVFELKRDLKHPGLGSTLGIQALDFLRRQPYQLNSAMFGGSSAPMQQATNQYQYQPQREGYTLNPPRQIPVKAARVYEIRRFSTPTPTSAPTMAPKVIAPRSATTLGERISRSDMISPPPAPRAPPPVPFSAHKTAPVPFPQAAHPGGLPELPKISANPIPNAHPVPYTPTAMSGLSYAGGLQAAKQFKSAPELCTLPPLRPAPVQVPKPRFVATRGGFQPRVWRPGTLPHWTGDPHLSPVKSEHHPAQRGHTTVFSYNQLRLLNC